MNFSDEVLICILKQLDVRSLMRFELSCTKYFLLGQDTFLWKYLIKRDYTKQKLENEEDLIYIYQMYFQEAERNKRSGYIDCICNDCKPQL